MITDFLSFWNSFIMMLFTSQYALLFVCTCATVCIFGIVIHRL